MHVISAPQVRNTNDVSHHGAQPLPEQDGGCNNMPKQAAFFTEEAINQLQNETPLIITFPVE
jgi:hypothetical protein